MTIKKLLFLLMLCNSTFSLICQEKTEFKTSNEKPKEQGKSDSNDSDQNDIQEVEFLNDPATTETEVEEINETSTEESETEALPESIAQDNLDSELNEEDKTASDKDNLEIKKETNTSNTQEAFDEPALIEIPSSTIDESKALSTQITKPTSEQTTASNVSSKLENEFTPEIEQAVPVVLEPTIIKHYPPYKGSVLYLDSSMIV